MFCIPVLLWLSGCAGTDQPFLPVTSGESAVPAVVEAACGNVFEYVSTSSCLTIRPPKTGWVLEEQQSKGEYHYRNGSWDMVIWFSDVHEENQRVVVFNKVERVYWGGYIRQDGTIVDTSYLP
jgi:hypothetical protein